MSFRTDTESYGPAQLVTQAQAAAMLGVDEDRVSALADSGEIWSLRMGGARRYRGPELRALVTTVAALPQQRVGLRHAADAGPNLR
jgi:hypothetical protein